MKRSTPNSVLAHWHHPIAGFSTSTQEFYAAVEAGLKEHSVPGIAISRIEWKEAGILSARREYLRVKREKLTYDVCAAPFGADYFFSSWLAEVPPRWGLLKMAAILLGLFVSFGLVVGIFTEVFGQGLGTLVAVPLGIIAWPVIVWALANALRNGSFGPNAEESVIETPVIGWLYVKLFEPATYYRVDTTMAFQAAVHDAVLKAVEQVTEGKVSRPLTDLERRPIMRGILAKAQSQYAGGS